MVLVNIFVVHFYFSVYCPADSCWAQILYVANCITIPVMVADEKCYNNSSESVKTGDTRNVTYSWTRHAT